MKKEDLVNLGIEEDVAKQILIIHGKDIESLKQSVSESTSETAALKTQLQESLAKIESFGDVDAMKLELDKWKAEAEKVKGDSERNKQEMTVDFALEKALLQSKAKNSKAVRALIEVDKISISEDGEITGLSEQLETIKSENDFLFESEDSVPRIVTGSQGLSGSEDATIDALRKAAGLR